MSLREKAAGLFSLNPRIPPQPDVVNAILTEKRLTDDTTARLNQGDMSDAPKNP